MILPDGTVVHQVVHFKELVFRVLEMIAFMKTFLFLLTYNYYIIDSFLLS